MGYILLVPILGVILILLFDVQLRRDAPSIIGMIVVGAGEFLFFRWMSEMLAAVKKMAGLKYNPSFTAFEGKHKCSWCDTPLSEPLDVCPRCKRQLVWPPA